MGCRRIENWNYSSVTVHPIAEVSLALFERRDAQNRGTGTAPNSETLVAEKEIGFLAARPQPGDFDGPTYVPPKIVFEVLGSFGYAKLPGI